MESNPTLTKIPHPNGGPDDRVGVLLSKDFLQAMENGTLSSDLPEAKEALDIARANSYWTSTRKRVFDRISKSVPNPLSEEESQVLLTIPQILPHGTLSRRVVESLTATLTSTKDYKVGSELKTRIRVPDGWALIQADFDSEEVNIASLYADYWEGGFIGASPMTFTTLSGSKDDGTDAHTQTAKLLFPDMPPGARDVAKAVNFSLLYGAGYRSIVEFIKKHYPDRDLTEITKLVKNALAKKKGIKGKDGFFKGGTDSGAYNYMVQVGLKSSVPTLPCLGSKISTSLRPSAVGRDFSTSRTNWCIQAGGAEMLSLFLTSVKYVSRYYKIPFHFIISVHDEVVFMVPKNLSELATGVMQVAHLMSWARYHASMGINNVPLARAYFSGVSIDERMRKSPKDSTVSPSNPNGGQEPPGKEYQVSGEIFEKLRKRRLLIDKGIL
jgi:DNA polymerase gamma 1